MADQKLANCIFIKLSILKFLGLLNPNLITKFQNTE